MEGNVNAARLAKLRAAMAREGVDTLIIPTADYHNSEYVADCFKAREYYCGFTGSAGVLVVRISRPAGYAAGEEEARKTGAIVAAEPSDRNASQWEAALWADGRYFIQAETEIRGSGVDLMKMGEPGVPTLHAYLKAHMPSGSVLAFDGRCITKAEGEELTRILAGKGISIRTDLDLAAECWENRPALPSHKVFLLDAERYAGETAESKLARLRAQMVEKGVQAYVSGKLDEIMWLFNTRGNDVECNPVALSYAVIGVNEEAVQMSGYRCGAILYIQESELTDEFRSYAESLGLILRPYANFIPELDAMHFAEGAVWIDPDYTSFSVSKAIHADAGLLETPSPIDYMKSIKNATEIRNFKDVYIEDSAALTKFIYWIKKQMGALRPAAEADSPEEKTAQAGSSAGRQASQKDFAEDRKAAAGQAGAPDASLTEGAAAAYLDGLRAKISDYVELSFPTISAYGSNAAMMHYEPGADGGAVLKPEGMLLVDSGGSYFRGTTDVTRTISLGPVTEDMRRSYTLTAVSQLQLMQTVFLKGCSGIALDIMAREPMWENGMDYKCGTGHGIGYLLNVHEGPQTIRYRRRNTADLTPFAPGMVVSDEPGVYKEGEYGIRIETILLCREWGTTPDGTFYCFEPLTFAPLDRDLIDVSVLTPKTRAALNAYHRQVYEKISPFLNEEEKVWLAAQCAEI